MTRDDLYDHYRQLLCAQQRLLAVAGDFRSGRMLARIRELFGPLPAAAPACGARSARNRSSRASAGWRSRGRARPPTWRWPTTPRRPPTRISSRWRSLDSVLAGASNFNLFGGGLSNKTSRLYRGLVESELAASVGRRAWQPPSTRTCIRSAPPCARAAPPSRPGGAGRRSGQRCSQAPIRAQDLAKAIKQARALFAYSSESVTNQAYLAGLAPRCSPTTPGWTPTWTGCRG